MFHYKFITEVISPCVISSTAVSKYGFLSYYEENCRPNKSSILSTALNEKNQSEAARLHILSTTMTTTNNLKNPSSYVTHNMNNLESTTTRISDPFINCHSKIGID